MKIIWLENYIANNYSGYDETLTTRENLFRELNYSVFDAFLIPIVWIYLRSQRKVK